jgi:hypothetical protein
MISCQENNKLDVCYTDYADQEIEIDKQKEGAGDGGRNKNDEVFAPASCYLIFSVPASLLLLSV